MVTIIVSFILILYLVRWEFFTEEGDIGFEIYNKKDKKKFHIVPNERIDTHLCKQEGELVCKDISTRKWLIGNNKFKTTFTFSNMKYLHNFFFLLS